MSRDRELVNLGPVRWFGEIDSTNRFLADEARGGARSGLVAVAGHQTAGKGRLGRRWDAPAGENLLMSVLLRPGGDVDPHYVNVCLAMAAADACRALAGVDAGLKWPNDLVVGERKLAGVLAELVTAAEGGARPAVVVGIGLNVNWSPPDGDAPGAPLATSLSREMADSGRRRLAVDEVLGRVLEHLDARIMAVFATGGTRRLIGEYRERCVTIGTRVTVLTVDGAFSGTATGVTDAGHLVVRDERCREREFGAGDVVHAGRAELRPSATS